VQAHRQDWVCVMPGSQYQSSKRLAARVARQMLPLIGSGTVAQRVQRKIEELGLENRLKRLPFITDIAPYHAASDILLFPATRPHFARPVIEAAAMAKPAIGSDLGGVNELIVHNETGLLVEPANPQVLADAILSLLADAEERRRLGENAYHLARERFDVQTNVRQIEQIYEAVLNK
jgi:glycosyltransferase involved in cell wall biosynthesis